MSNSLESAVLLEMADDYLMQEKHKSFGIDHRIRLAYISGLAKGHTMAYNVAHEAHLDREKAKH